MTRVEALHPNPDKATTRIDAVLYEDVRAAILSAIASRQAVSFGELAGLVEAGSPSTHWGKASVGWYTTTVKLDLEARGLIERHGDPQMLTLTELGERVTNR